MILKISNTILVSRYQMIFTLSARRFSKNAVPLAFTEFKRPDSLNADKNLIVLHGLFGSKSNWNSLCKAFAARTNPARQIFAIDARNHGDSPHTIEHNNDVLADDIRKFMQDRDLERAALLGHSMGGRAVMHFALKYPELVEKLIVVDISPRGRIGTTQSDIPLFIHAMKSIVIPKSYTMQQARNAADEELQAIISEKSLRDFLITNLTKSETGDFRWRINLETLDRCFQEGIAKFPDVTGLKCKAPTLFVGGSKSDYLKQSDEPYIKELFPNSRLEYLDAGHWVHAEKSEDFLNLTTKFLIQ